MNVLMFLLCWSLSGVHVRIVVSNLLVMYGLMNLKRPRAGTNNSEVSIVVRSAHSYFNVLVLTEADESNTINGAIKFGHVCSSGSPHVTGQLVTEGRPPATIPQRPVSAEEDVAACHNHWKRKRTGCRCESCWGPCQLSWLMSPGAVHLPQFPGGDGDVMDVLMRSRKHSVKNCAQHHKDHEAARPSRRAGG